MAESPIVPLSLIGLSLAFMGLLYGSELAQDAFPTFEQPSSGGWIGALDALLAVVQGVWGVIVWLGRAITFDVPGAPWYIRLAVGTYFGGAIVWAIATLFRGN